MTTAAEAAIELHVRRIVEAHGLDEPTARNAVAVHRRGERGEHHDVAHRAALEVYAALCGRSVESLLAAIRADVERRVAHLRPLFDALLRAMADAPQAGEAYRRAVAESQPRREVLGEVPVTEVVAARAPRRPPAARARPAWQSPFGPPARRSSRKG
ncbi:hypothetical protein ACH4YN_37920 [Streptomyces griseofuscus]|uniref:hypothetical protein n=1 Tax=Streptomyces griseofuscus TaxID=146922 RepID=UPI0037B73671